MPAQTPIQSSTQQHLSIADIQDNLVLLKDGSCCLILKTTAINFGLLSEREQEATIFAYAGLLNSLTFPIQILIHSQQKDISSYLSLIDQHLANQKSAKLKDQMQKYRQFVESTIKKNRVLDKKFYLAIPFTSVQFKKSRQKILLEKAKTDLLPKKDHLINQLQRLGLKTQQLTSQEIISLVYNIYNPEAEGQKFIPSQEYAGSLVQSQTKTSKAPKPTEPIPAITPTPPAPTQVAATPVSVSTPKVEVQPQNQEPAVMKKTAPTIPPAAPTPLNVVKPTSFNLMKGKKEETRVLEGQKLQDQINNIVQKVTSQPENKTEKNKN